MLSAIASGDQRAVREMVSSKLPRVVALAYRILGDRSEADDIAQETFVRLWRVAPKWRDKNAKLDTWIHTVALNLCRDRLRKSRRVELGVVPEAEDPADAADLVIEADQRSKLVMKAMNSLPDRQREAIVLQYYQGLTNNASADVMGISVDALESLLSRGRKRLREILLEIGE